MDRLPSEITDRIMQFAGPRATLSLASTSRSNKAAFNASKRALTRHFFQPCVINEKYNNIKELYESQWWNLLRLDTFFMPTVNALNLGNIELKIEGKINQQEPDHPLLEGTVKVTMVTLLMDDPLHTGNIYERECFFRRGKLNGLSRDHVETTFDDDLHYDFLLCFMDGELDGMQLIQMGERVFCVFAYDDGRMSSSVTTHINDIERPSERIRRLLTSVLTAEEIQAELSEMYNSYYDRIAGPEGPFSLPSHNSEGERINYGDFSFRTHGHLITLSISHRSMRIWKIYTSYGTDDDESMFNMASLDDHPLSFFERCLYYNFPSLTYQEGEQTCELEQLPEGLDQSDSTEGRYGGEEVQIIPGIRIYFLDTGKYGYLVTAITVDGFKSVDKFSNPYQIKYYNYWEKIRDTFIPVWE